MKVLVLSGRFGMGHEICIYWLFLQFGNTIGDRRTAIAAICDEQR